MGTIIGDFFKKVGRGIDKMTDGDIWDGLGDVLGAPLDAAGRTVNGALNFVGLGEEELEPGAKLLLCETALLAKMAKSDGRVDKSEIDFVNAVFDDLELEGEVRKALQGFFNEQKKDVSDVAEWAQGVLQAVVEMNPEDEDCGVEIRLQVYRHLFLMALADGELDDREIAMLRAIPDPLGFKPEVFDLVVAELSEGGEGDGGDTALADAYATLGVSPDATDAEVRAAYKRKIAAFHPDKIQGKDLDPEWVELANEKSAKINAAWEIIKKARETHDEESVSCTARNSNGRGKAKKKTKTTKPGKGKASTGERASTSDELVYRCPACDTCFAVPECTDEYRVECPDCGAMVDLTEIEPE